MRLLSTILFGFTVISATVQADESNIWVELAAGGGGEFFTVGVNIKFGNNDSNWAIELGQYDDFNILSYVENRENGNALDLEVTTIGITKNWNSIGNWGYLDAGIGLGAAKGIWASNCSEEKTGTSLFSSTRKVCDSTDGVRLGVPLHVSAVFGKYVGLGITLKAFITSEDSHAGLMFTLPFGDFTN